ncbi:hypothetical protein ACROYT_G014146 [Oculina patagonica]
MPVCAAAFCTNRAPRDTKRGISFHRLPLSKRKIAQEWLRRMGRNEKFLPKQAQLFVCSDHFTDDCFEVEHRFDLLGGNIRKRKKKPEAIPTIFKKSPAVKVPFKRHASERRQKAKDRREEVERILENARIAEQVAEEAKKTGEVENRLEEELLGVNQSADVSDVPEPEQDTITEAPVKTFVHVATQTKPLDFSVKKWPVVETPEQQSKVGRRTTECSNKSKPDSMPAVETVILEQSDESEEEWDDDVDDAGSVGSCDTSDEDWEPEDEEDSDNENADFSPCPDTNWLEETEHSSNERKSIVFDSCLKQLFQFCRNCGATVINADLRQRGTLICV